MLKTQVTTIKSSAITRGFTIIVGCHNNPWKPSICYFYISERSKTQCFSVTITINDQVESSRLQVQMFTYYLLPFRNGKIKSIKTKIALPVLPLVENIFGHCGDDGLTPILACCKTGQL